MHNAFFTREPGEERRQLWIMAAVFGGVSGLLFFLAAKPAVACALAALAALALTGALAYRWVGRDIYLIFGLVSLLISSLMSWAALAFLYVLGVFCFGLLLLPFRLDRMRKSFDAAKRRKTHFEDTPASGPDSFRRQS